MFGRSLLLQLADNKKLESFARHNRWAAQAARRFVAGETIEEAIAPVQALNRNGISASLDLLGENVQSRDDARHATREVLEMLDALHSENADCNVSVKLTQLGLDLDTEFCYQNLREIVTRAASQGNFVRVDMEGSRYTQPTLELVSRARKEFDNVGPVIQAYLYRSEEDVRRLKDLSDVK